MRLYAGRQNHWLVSDVQYLHIHVHVMTSLPACVLTALLWILLVQNWLSPLKPRRNPVSTGACLKSKSLAEVSIALRSSMRYNRQLPLEAMVQHLHLE